MEDTYSHIASSRELGTIVGRVKESVISRTFEISSIDGKGLVLVDIALGSSRIPLFTIFTHITVIYKGCTVKLFFSQ